VPYDEDLAARLRDLFARRREVAEKRMFGGAGFFLDGNLLVGVWGDSLVARLGPNAGELALDEPHVRPYAPAGKPMRGWVLVDPPGIEDDGPLADWVARARAFVEMLPAKLGLDRESHPDVARRDRCPPVCRQRYVVAMAASCCHRLATIATPLRDPADGGFILFG
jgi:hypothetical protein